MLCTELPYFSSFNPQATWTSLIEVLQNHCDGGRLGTDSMAGRWALGLD